MLDYESAPSEAKRRRVSGGSSDLLVDEQSNAPTVAVGVPADADERQLVERFLAQHGNVASPPDRDLARHRAVLDAPTASTSTPPVGHAAGRAMLDTVAYPVLRANDVSAVDRVGKFLLVSRANQSDAAASVPSGRQITAASRADFEQSTQSKTDQMIGNERRLLTALVHYAKGETGVNKYLRDKETPFPFAEVKSWAPVSLVPRARDAAASASTATSTATAGASISVTLSQPKTSEALPIASQAESRADSTSESDDESESSAQSASESESESESDDESSAQSASKSDYESDYESDLKIGPDPGSFTGDSNDEADESEDEDAETKIFAHRLLAESMHRAIWRYGQTVPPGVLLSRRLRLDVETVRDLLKVKGQVLQDPGFFSTSFAPSVLAYLPERDEVSVQFRFTVGTGVHGLYLGKRAISAKMTRSLASATNKRQGGYEAVVARTNKRSGEAREKKAALTRWSRYLPTTQSGVSAISGYVEQDEVLLPPNTRFSVDGFSLSEKGVTDPEGFGTFTKDGRSVPVVVIHATLLASQKTQ